MINAKIPIVNKVTKQALKINGQLTGSSLS
jgi:hypothetical protein